MNLEIKKAVNVLIVDDSRVFRNFLSKAFDKIDTVNIVGAVENGKQALQFLSNKGMPDAIVLDMEMPVLDGLGTVKAIRQRIDVGSMPNICIILVSGNEHKDGSATIEALQLGAFDFVRKVAGPDREANFNLLRQSLLTRLDLYRAKSQSARFITKKQVVPIEKDEFAPVVLQKIDDHHDSTPIIIGVSTGGPKALMQFLPALTKVTDRPIIIVQHILPGYTDFLAKNLNSACGSPVVQATNEVFVSRNTVYLAPSDCHIIAHKASPGPRLLLSEKPPIGGHRPSIDLIFESAAVVWDHKLIAIILTGMGADGTQGLGKLKETGATIIAQDEATSVVWGMPGSAVRAGYTDFVLPLMKIPETVLATIRLQNTVGIP